jgi:hypothetical protein
VTRLIALIAFLAIAACGAVPQPFQGSPKVTTDNPLLDMPTAVGIAVLPVRGAPAPLATQISTAVAARLQSLEIPAEAVPVNDGLGFTLEAEARPGEAVAPDIAVVLTWTLRARRGTTGNDPFRTYRQVVNLPIQLWQEGDTALAARLGDEAGVAMGDLINGIAPPVIAAPLPAPPAAPKFPKVSIQPVEGAPGDGRESLRLAVLAVLSNNGVGRDDVNPEVTLKCDITLTPVEPNLQRVEILWRAVLRDGRELGTVRLDNTLPQGALDGQWGAAAFAIADAALGDLLTLLASQPAP